MSRSLFKPVFVHKSLFEDCLKNKERNILKNNVNISKFLYFWAKHSSINTNLVDKKIGIYNGKVFITLNVSKNIMGYKLGQFCITRKKPPHVGKQKQTKKVSRSLERLVKERKRIVNKGKYKKK